MDDRPAARRKPPPPRTPAPERAKTKKVPPPPRAPPPGAVSKNRMEEPRGRFGGEEKERSLAAEVETSRHAADSATASRTSVPHAKETVGEPQERIRNPADAVASADETRKVLDGPTWETRKVDDSQSPRGPISPAGLVYSNQSAWETALDESASRRRSPRRRKSSKRFVPKAIDVDFVERTENQQATSPRRNNEGSSISPTRITPKRAVRTVQVRSPMMSRNKHKGLSSTQQQSGSSAKDDLHKRPSPRSSNKQAHQTDATSYEDLKEEKAEEIAAEATGAGARRPRRRQADDPASNREAVERNTLKSPGRKAVHSVVVRSPLAFGRDNKGTPVESSGPRISLDTPRGSTGTPRDHQEPTRNEETQFAASSNGESPWPADRVGSEEESEFSFELNFSGDDGASDDESVYPSPANQRPSQHRLSIHFSPHGNHIESSSRISRTSSHTSPGDERNKETLPGGYSEEQYGDRPEKKVESTQQTRIFDPLQLPVLLAELRAFIASPPDDGPGVLVRCFIERDREASRGTSTLFTLFADHQSGCGRAVLYAKRVMSLRGAHYVISMLEDDLHCKRQKRLQYLGKLRGSSAGDTYTLYDDGDNPDDVLLPPSGFADQERREQSSLRRELLAVRYSSPPTKSDLFSSLAQLDRTMEVIMPQVSIAEDGNEVREWRPWKPTKEDTLVATMDVVRKQGAQNVAFDEDTLIMHQRKSKYDPETSAAREYDGRAKCASEKNFQLVKSIPTDGRRREEYLQRLPADHRDRKDDSEKEVLLQMARVGSDCFNLDYKWPFSMLQAFAVALSRFDRAANRRLQR